MNKATNTIMILHHGGDQIRGSEACLLHTIDAIRDADYNIIIVRKDPCMDELISNKVSTIVNESFPEIMFDGSHRTFPIISYFKSFRRLYKLTKQYRPSVIYCNTGLPCQLAVPIAKLLSVPLLCHFHHPAPKRYFYFWLVKFADKLFFPSKFTRSVVHKKSGRDGDVIYNAVDIDNRFIPAPLRNENHRKILGFNTTDIVVGQVGALTEHKRPDALLQCFADAYSINKNLRLVLIGGGSMLGQLSSLIEQLQLNGVVKLAGYVPDVLDYYQHVFDINVLASTNEGLGISVIEASACGLPSIVTDCTGLREVVDDNITGLMFKENDLSQLTTHILNLSKNPGSRQRFGAAARQKTEKYFSLDTYKKGILNQIQELRNQSKR